jgi:hypothetical protein
VKRLLPWFVLTAVVLSTSIPLRASSLPVIAGEVSGIELCPQDWCGAAIFAGIYSGRVGINPHALGIMTVAVTHTDLPELGETALITGGLWRLRLLSGRTITGVVTYGELTNPFDDDTFGVSVDLLILSGGIGTLSFDGILSHQVFPPTIGGALTQ